jgi:hypothetical protein
MPLTKLQFNPGINRETTSYTNEGGWFDGEKIRFRFGLPEKIGGWKKSTSVSFLGGCRALKTWVSLDNSQYTGIGTHLKYYLQYGQEIKDITPLRTTTTSGISFSASANTLSADIAVADLTIPLTSASGFPDSGRIKIDSEEITYTGISSNNLTGCTRGAESTTAATHTSSTAVGCATIQVALSTHGAEQYDFVTLSGAAALGGNITANVLNQEYQITTIESVDVFYIEARTAGTSLQDITVDGELVPTFVYPTSSDSGSGASSTAGAFQISVGLNVSVAGNGWGAGTWSRGTWNSAADTSSSLLSLRIWSHDNFGERLLMNVRDGGIYYWDTSTRSSNFSRAVELNSITDTDGSCPQIAKQIMVSDINRHIIAFGCDPESALGTQDPLLIRFSSQESLTSWQSTALNTAGELKVGAGSEIICAVETRQQIIVFTDASVHAMQYLGDPYIFGISQISENTTIMSPLCAKAVDDNIFWMGFDDFYVYNGAVQKLPCSVKQYVFNDFNILQREKVFAGLNSSFNEIWWFYCSEDSNVLDKYVVYNYLEEAWCYGNLARTAWNDRGVTTYPLAAGTDGFLYDHELGLDDGSTSPATAISAHIESSQMDLGDGEQFSFIRRYLPDVTFDGSTATNPSTTFTMKARNYPGGNYLASDADSVTRSVAGTTSVVEQFTNQVNIRLRGRSFALRVASSDIEVQWRLGTPRVDIRPDGRR